MTKLDKEKLVRIAYHVMAVALSKAYEVETGGHPVEMASVLEQYDPFSQDELDYILAFIEGRVSAFEKGALEDDCQQTQGGSVDKKYNLPAVKVTTVPHCDHPSCGFGVAEYRCPYCLQHVQDYDLYLKIDDNGRQDPVQCAKCVGLFAVAH